MTIEAPDRKETSKFLAFQAEASYAAAGFQEMKKFKEDAERWIREIPQKIGFTKVYLSSRLNLELLKPAVR